MLRKLNFDKLRWKTEIENEEKFCDFQAFFEGLLKISKILFFIPGLSPDLQSMEQIRRIMRPTDVPDQGNDNTDNALYHCTLNKWAPMHPCALYPKILKPWSMHCTIYWIITFPTGNSETGLFHQGDYY